jgi:4-diphosphocytidyl-2-C-methyl-D-erythritol kinase
MKVCASAKINLYLDVIRRRDDGFHEIETLYQPVSLWDELTFTKTHSGIVVEGNDARVPWNEDNLCHKAASLVLARHGRGAGVRIQVVKGIPPGAGLGGGSSDAAATLLAVNRLFECGLTEGDLAALAASLGSDVPFFILGRPAIGRGRGELLEEVGGLRKGWILIAKPDVTVSTKWAYQNLNLVLTRGDGKATLAALLEGLQRFPSVPLETYNSFEAGIRKRFRSVSGILEDLQAENPVLSSLSGSGSACFALFTEESEARRVGERLNNRGIFARVVQPVDAAMRFA